MMTQDPGLKPKLQHRPALDIHISTLSPPLLIRCQSIVRSATHLYQSLLFWSGRLQRYPEPWVSQNRQNPPFMAKWADTRTIEKKWSHLLTNLIVQLEYHLHQVLPICSGHKPPSRRDMPSTFQYHSVKTMLPGQMNRDHLDQIGMILKLSCNRHPLWSLPRRKKRDPGRYSSRRRLFHSSFALWSCYYLKTTWSFQYKILFYFN